MYTESPLNHSLSKQKYTFSKAPRITHDAKSHSQATFYNIPDTLSKRMAGIGYGFKEDLSKYASKNPAPNQYDISGFAEYNNEHKKGVTLGPGRDETKLQGIWGTLNLVSPPPDRYQLPPGFKNGNFSFGLRPEQKNKQNNPGPGQYEAPQATSDKGRYFLSKFQSSGASIIGKDKERFKTLTSIRYQQNQVNNNPEPGRYSLDNLGISPNGFYPKNGYRSTVQQSFGKAARNGPFEKLASNPGPGSYKCYSEFG